MKNGILLLFFTVLLAACQEKTEKKESSNEVESSKKVVESGEALFKKRCVSCHGIDGKMGFAGAKDLSKSTLPLTMIEIQVTHGKGAMNGFEKILSTEEIKEVSAYAFKFRERI